MTDRELMQQALDALEYAANETQPEDLYGCNCLICKTIEALRGRLAQTEPGPVAWMVYTQDGQSVYVTDNPTQIQDRQQALPLYTTPPQRPWVGLTDEELSELSASGLALWELWKAIEAKLRSKNT